MMATVNSYTGFMPTPDRTSLTEIVAVASDILESDGLTGLTMQAVAQRVGVRAPSLYKRVESRDRLIQLVAESSLAAVADRLNAASNAAELLNTYRSYSHERPAAFQLAMMPGPHTPVADQRYWVAAGEAILRVSGELAGSEQALVAARTLTAWGVGFIGMELNGAFKLGGDVEQAWEFGLARIIESLAATRGQEAAPR